MQLVSLKCAIFFVKDVPRFFKIIFQTKKWIFHFHGEKIDDLHSLSINKRLWRQLGKNVLPSGYGYLYYRIPALSGLDVRSELAYTQFLLIWEHLNLLECVGGTVGSDNQLSSSINSQVKRLVSFIWWSQPLNFWGQTDEGWVSSRK